MRHRILHLMCLLTCVVVLMTATYGPGAQVIYPQVIKPSCPHLSNSLHGSRNVN
jgi:hypothetical protein